MKPKNENYISKTISKGRSNDQKNKKKSIFQDHIESVTIPRDPGLAFWLRRRKRENGSERTFVAPPRPLRFRSLPPYLLPTLYALPAIIGNMMRVLKKQKQKLYLCYDFYRPRGWSCVSEHPAAPRHQHVYVSLFKFDSFT